MDETHNASIFLCDVFSPPFLWDLDDDLYVHTLPETNIAPENGPSQKETSIPTINFQGLC